MDIVLAICLLFFAWYYFEMQFYFNKVWNGNGILILDVNPTFRTLFLDPLILSAFQPSIAFRGAKHCFSPEKAMLLSKRSIAWLLWSMFSLQKQAKKCSKLLIWL